LSDLNSENIQKIAVVMGSDSDLKTLKPSVDILKEFEIETEVCILSAHRTPFEMMEYAKKAESNNIKVIIAGAGGAAHLPGMLASLTCIPVIGVPIESKTLKGIDSLLSIVQMPAGIPVATVAINGAQNAGLLAIQIMSLFDQTLKLKLKQFRVNLHTKVRDKNLKLLSIGPDNYLKNK
tara:strand:- start:1742 stop:2278 length:537 start_codon:yes stop_codon:yes gene_type:complete